MVCLLCLILLAADEPPRVAFLRPPSFISEDFAAPFYVRVPLATENRLLAVAAFDGEFRVQYTERDLSSEGRKTVWDIVWRLPAGDIVLVAAVFGDLKELARDTHTVHVLSRSP